MVVNSQRMLYHVFKLIFYTLCSNATYVSILICTFISGWCLEEYHSVSCDLKSCAFHGSNLKLCLYFSSRPTIVGGLEILVNLLETDDPKCKIGSLLILKELCTTPSVKKSIADSGAMVTVVNLLEDENELLRCLAATTIATCAFYARNRRTVRHTGGIQKLVAMLKESVVVAKSSALALCSCCKSLKNKNAMVAAGALPLLATLLKSDNIELLLPVVGILEVFPCPHIVLHL